MGARPCPDRYVLGAVPLSRPGCVELLGLRAEPPAGAHVDIVAQRPDERAEAAWRADLADRLAAGGGDPDAEVAAVTVADLLDIDDPALHLQTQATDRLVPPMMLDDGDFLTRNLGGWAPVYFDVFGLPDELPDDPVLQALEVLVDYGDAIESVTADPDLVAARLGEEAGGDAAHAAAAIVTTGRLLASLAPDAAVDALLGLLDEGAVRPVFVYDALLSVLTTTEQRRRACLAAGDTAGAGALSDLQATWRERHDLRLILKAEYIAGRYRRSTVLLAAGLGVVVKQPAPEPLHEIALGHRVHAGQEENWPVAVDGGALVTPRGRLRMMVEDGGFARVAAALDYPTQFCTLLGVTVEPYVTGRTLLEVVHDDPTALDRHRYEEILLHQQVCEVLDVDNADWHAANFMVPDHDGRDRPPLVHVDWGAARALEPHERRDADPGAAAARVDQVRNLGFSFGREDLAERVADLHREVTGDPQAMERLRREAARMAG